MLQSSEVKCYQYCVVQVGALQQQPLQGEQALAAFATAEPFCSQGSYQPNQYFPFDTIQKKTVLYGLHCSQSYNICLLKFGHQSAVFGKQSRVQARDSSFSV